MVQKPENISSISAWTDNHKTLVQEDALLFTRWLGVALQVCYARYTVFGVELTERNFPLSLMLGSIGA